MAKVGRPLKFKSVSELQKKIDDYFDIYLKKEKEPVTITGLALYLETTRELLCDYAKRDEFSDTIKKAKLRVEKAYELRGMEKGTAFDIFRLKNMGWKDKQEYDHTSKGEKLFSDDQEKRMAKRLLDKK